MKKIVRVSASLAVLLTFGAGFASAQSADDTVDVSMNVTFSRSMEMAFDGNLVVDAVNTITQDFFDEFGNPNGDSQQLHVGYVEGCIHLQGVDKVTVTTSGANPDPDGSGPYLKYTDASDNDYFLNYRPELMGRWDTSVSWDSVASYAFVNNPNDSGVAHIGGIQYGPNGPQNTSVSTDQYILGTVGGSTQSGCNGGTENNIALFVGVGVRDGHAYFEQDPNNPIQHFGSINNLAGSSNLAADTAYSFSDQLTVTIAPDLS